VDALETLLAEREIERMIVAYAAANDAGEWDAIGAMYAHGGRMSRPTAPDEFIEGRDQIVAAFKARPARTARHIVANIRVDLAGENATATSQILLFTGPDKIPLVGTYRDNLVKTPEGWRFTERRGSLDFA
jgi:hypothetical protein